jgi:aspartate kinase
MNADPRYFECQFTESDSYREAIELAFYGATVIHPKNITTLTKKGNSLICKVLYQPVVKEQVYPEVLI